MSVETTWSHYSHWHTVDTDTATALLLPLPVYILSVTPSPSSVSRVKGVVAISDHISQWGGYDNLGRSNHVHFPAVCLLYHQGNLSTQQRCYLLNDQEGFCCVFKLHRMNNNTPLWAQRMPGWCELFCNSNHLHHNVFLFSCVCVFVSRLFMWCYRVCWTVIHFQSTALSPAGKEAWGFLNLCEGFCR